MGRYSFLSAVALGVLADVLLRAWPMGLGVALWLLLLVFAIWLQGRITGGWARWATALLAASSVLGFGLAGHASLVVEVANMGASACCVLLAALQLRLARRRVSAFKVEKAKSVE